ncbi:BON domain protein [Symmachiella macrocystis]|uniref:BON domain protein n=1 Tax=Symmachiella macrocystis TaxID=2527985 RepID=A0A5C6B5W3_9PLAN|nr:BON domain-containing protein [Symmachiella macrocystis]TWU07340.1 BON domain protein [Symmachiella macrocystis]
MPTHEIHAAHKLNDEIHFQIQRDLSAFGRNVSYEVNDSDVVLSGVVGSYYHKQMAQESLRRIEGLSRIDNRIQVVIR